MFYRACRFLDRIEAHPGAEMMLIDPDNINAIANPFTHIQTGALADVLVHWMGGIDQVAKMVSSTCRFMVTAGSW